MSEVKGTETKVGPTVLGVVEIAVLSDGGVSVKGPVGNPIIMMNIFGKALLATADHAAKEMNIAPQKSDIVVP